MAKKVDCRGASLRVDAVEGFCIGPRMELGLVEAADGSLRNRMRLVVSVTRVERICRGSKDILLFRARYCVGRVGIFYPKRVKNKLGALALLSINSADYDRGEDIVEQGEEVKMLYIITKSEFQSQWQNV